MRLWLQDLKSCHVDRISDLAMPEAKTPPFLTLPELKPNLTLNGALPFSHREETSDGDRPSKRRRPFVSSSLGFKGLGFRQHGGIQGAEGFGCGV